MALDDLGTGGAGDRYGIVVAVIGDDEQTVTGTQLTLDVGQRGQELVAFVMGRHHDCDARAGAIIWAQPFPTRGQRNGAHNLQNEHGNGNRDQECDEHKQAGGECPHAGYFACYGWLRNLIFTGEAGG
jgi:hypothetical protein